MHILFFIKYYLRLKLEVHEKTSESNDTLIRVHPTRARAVSLDSKVTDQIFITAGVYFLII